MQKVKVKTKYKTFKFISIEKLCEYFGMNVSIFNNWRSKNKGKKDRKMKIDVEIEFEEEK